MFTKFWMWLLGFKDDEGEDTKTGKQSSGRDTDSTDSSIDDEGNFRSGPEGYQGR
jgi:hypothetical protein